MLALITLCISIHGTDGTTTACETHRAANAYVAAQGAVRHLDQTKWSRIVIDTPTRDLAIVHLVLRED